MRTALATVRSVLAAVLAAALLLFAPAQADDEADHRAALDILFAELKDARDANTARAIDQQIWVLWTSPTDPVLAAKMLQILQVRMTGDVAVAITLADGVIADYPGYAEGWNQRATLYYLAGNFEASIADCEKVLELEPRHFGALSGRSLMYLQMGERALALRDMAAAVAVHPFLPGRELFPELMRETTHV